MYTYDDQLIDSVRVRRRRMVHGLLHRDDRLRRNYSDRLGTFAASFVITALACAGCVAGSFITDLMSQEQSGGQTNPQAAVTNQERR